MSPAVPPRRRNASLLLGIAVGLLAFAAGVALASAFLPEWRAGGLADRSVFLERYRKLAAKAGLSLDPGEPRVFLVTRGPEQIEPYRPLGDPGSRWLLATRTAFRVGVLHGVQGPGEAGRAGLLADFSLDGQPEYLSWWSKDLRTFFTPRIFFGGEAALPAALAPQLLAPGETLGPRQQEVVTAVPRVVYPIRGSRRPQFLFGVPSPQSGVLLREPGAPTPAAVARADATVVRMITDFWRAVPWFLVLGGLFLILLLKARIGVVNGTLLTFLALFTLLPGVPVFGPWPVALWILGAWAIAIFLLWCCAESLLRAGSVDFTTSLDALRAGRLGPRGGRALLAGFGFGSALAGLRLGLLALAEALPGAWASHSSVELPVFRPLGSPVAEGIFLAGVVALSLALALRILPVRWAPVAAALAAGLFLNAVPAAPGAVNWAANAAVAGVLVWIGRRHGLTALLAASVVSFLLPSAAFAARYLEWMPGSFAAAAGLAAALPVLGWLGLSRSATAEVQRLAPPAFVRRLEEERRFRHEMDLLAKMQHRLLPRTLPRIEGYELAAHSVIANEAGGDLYDVLADEEGYVWIAAGDVAGHGYSCAIAQAMTKSALASLVGRGRTPAEVLQRADRVLRAAGATRNFTSLALLRLRPETGEALVSNAGYPYPLLVADGEVTEIDISALPLGVGPARSYQDRPFQLPPGGVLVFCSDGLFEASDGGGRMYGFDRLHELVRKAGPRTADKILDLMFADWRQHLRAVQPLDDTTVVVVKRSGGGS
ncbi:MAG TPA: PP2C family protein-serine/threonine phosphatase [Thermoanaerobaculia bacterium]|jgi:serine phosphatase RsbU (regulator of sigma subunit)|nr:PP2C family protein-serine/threonine phosphatase [Thermoanaerobaculia bacterium]